MGRYFKEKKKNNTQTLVVPSQMVIDLSVATEHFYIGPRSSMLFLVEQALLWPGAATLSHLRFCPKGLI